VARIVTVEVDPGSDPIRGLISDAGGTRPFFGWLELASALQAALDVSDQDDVTAV
jgi:hypothetical protein